MDMIRRGSQWLGGQLARHAATEITYRQGSASLSIPGATKVRRDIDVLDDDGMMTVVQVYEWRCSANAFAVAAIKPRMGDEIVEIEDGEESVYEVMPIAGMPATQEMSTHGHRLKIRTKLVG
jgi:hypothetical protein